MCLLNLPCFAIPIFEYEKWKSQKLKAGEGGGSGEEGLKDI